MNTQNEIWIGLVGLYPLENNEYITQNEGAYTNILIMASSLDDYIEKVKKFVKWLDFDIFDYDDIRPFNVRRNKDIEYEKDEIFSLSEIIKETGEPQLSTLHVFDREDC
jgi:hypothetical protein